MVSPGTQFGAYRIHREVGRGGMSLIYHAIDTRTGGEVALKLLRPELAQEPTLLDLFAEEGRKASQLRHPNIVRVLEVGTIQDRHFIAMEYVPYGTLASLLRQRNAPFTVPEALPYLRKVASALDYAHSRGVLHRDVKPSNILLGNLGQVLLSDFGIAHPLGEQANVSVMAGGTPHYMAPEQVRHDPNCGTSADIYSLTVVAYALLTNQLPFDASTNDLVRRKILNEPPTRPTTWNPALSAAVEEVLLWGLNKVPTQRFASASELVDSLEYSDQQGVVPPSLARQQPPPPEKREPTFASAPSAPLPRRSIGTGIWILLFGLLLAAILAYFLFVRRDSAAASPSVPTATVIRQTVVIQSDTPTAQPTASETPTPLRPTATPTNEPSPTVIVVQSKSGIKVRATLADETVTLVATATPTAANTPTRKPTSTPVQFTPTSTATDTPTVTATSTPGPTKPYTPTPKTLSGETAALLTVGIGVKLLAPNDGDSISGKTEFRWQGDPPPAGFAYEVVFWKPGEDGMLNGQGWAGSTQGSSLSIDPINLGKQNGEYRWAVRLWDTSSNRPLKLVSEARRIIVQAPSSGGSGESGSQPAPGCAGDC